MLHQKLKVDFYLKDRKTDQTQLPLYIRIYVDGRKTEISTKHHLAKKDWDRKRHRVRPSMKNADLLNNYLSLVETKIQQYFLEYTARGLAVKPSDLKNKFMGIDENAMRRTICEAFDYHNAKMAEKVKIGLITQKTLNRYGFTKDKIVAFMKKQYNVKDMPLSDLKLGFVTHFEHYLLTNDELQSNTAYKYIKNLKRVMNMCIEVEWLESNPFNAFKCSYVNPERVVLTQEEIESMIAADIDMPRLAKIRDVFVFCCFTGFAYSDVYKFKKDALTIGIDGEYWITTRRKKTGTRESVPLLPVAMEIVKRYSNDPHCVKYDKLLPVVSNQRYNSYLKELATICGIKKELTSHIARHTFATTVTLSNGVPIETVSKMLGHTKLSTTQIYAKVLDHKVSDDMRALREKLSINKGENNSDQKNVI